MQRVCLCVDSIKVISFLTYELVKSRFYSFGELISSVSRKHQRMKKKIELDSNSETLKIVSKILLSLLNISSLSASIAAEFRGENGYVAQ